MISASLASAQDGETKRILARYDALRPTDRDLAMYQLDWAPSLEAALERAAVQHRPILLVIIHAQYGDLFSGHC